jgi:hypothetical protein
MVSVVLVVAINMCRIRLVSAYVASHSAFHDDHCITLLASSGRVRVVKQIRKLYARACVSIALPTHVSVSIPMSGPAFVSAPGHTAIAAPISVATTIVARVRTDVFRVLQTTLTQLVKVFSCYLRLLCDIIIVKNASAPCVSLPVAVTVKVPVATSFAPP